jgi:hypothetical protein
LTNIPATVPVNIINLLTTLKITEEETITITITETVERELVVLDARSPMVFMAMARAELKREEDRRIERVGGGELECVMKQTVHKDDRNGEDEKEKMEEMNDTG